MQPKFLAEPGAVKTAIRTTKISALTSMLHFLRYSPIMAYCRFTFAGWKSTGWDGGEGIRYEMNWRELDLFARAKNNKKLVIQAGERLNRYLLVKSANIRQIM
jgi:hypothetical protein